MSMSGAKMLSRLYPSDPKHTILPVVHSVCINIQNIEAHVVPNGITGIVAEIAIASATWVPVSTLAEIVRQLDQVVIQLNQQLVTPGYLYQHLSLSSIPNLSTVASSVLPAAAVLDSVCRTAVGISKIIFSKQEIDSQLPGIKPDDESAVLLFQGIYETLCGLGTTSLGIYALAVASAPIACLTFAIANYLDLIPMLLNSERTRTATLFKFIEATGYLLLTFGMPLGGLLLGASHFHKAFARAPTGNLIANLSTDVNRLTNWYSGKAAEDRPVQSSIDMDVVRRQPR